MFPFLFKSVILNHQSANVERSVYQFVYNCQYPYVVQVLSTAEKGLKNASLSQMVVWQLKEFLVTWKFIMFKVQ